MTTESAAELRGRLRGLGLSDGAITAAWPRWWSDEAEASSSARAELRFSVARRLGLDPHSLLARDEPRFLWREEARFKHLSDEDETQQAGITSFGRAIAAILVQAAPDAAGDLTGSRAAELRHSILASGQSYVTLVDLLSMAWGVGIPVAHLRVFPWPQKRMAAMAARVGARATVLLGKDSDYPAMIAFYLAHELGHIALGHVPTDRQVVDLDELVPGSGATDDAEEREADEFALELLTGHPQPTVLRSAESRGWGARSLADAVLRSADELGIEPGTLALGFGHSTGDWATAIGALRHVYEDARPVWQLVNRIARDQLDVSALGEDSLEFIDVVLGAAEA
jgi:hypothetical protein